MGKVDDGKPSSATSPETEASKMLEAALQQMDGIISGNNLRIYYWAIPNSLTFLYGLSPAIRVKSGCFDLWKVCLVCSAIRHSLKQLSTHGLENIIAASKQSNNYDQLEFDTNPDVINYMPTVCSRWATKR